MFVGKCLRVIIIKATIMKIVPTVAIDFGTKDNSKKKTKIILIQQVFIHFLHSAYYTFTRRNPVTIRSVTTIYYIINSFSIST